MSATVNKLVYGDLTFTDDEIQDGKVYDAVALLSDTLEIGTFYVGLYIRDEETGAALTAFRRNDKLLYYYRDKLRGTYYIESVQRTGKYTYEISANNAVALLEQSNHLGGIYTGQTVDELVAEICTIPYIIQSKFAGIKLYGWLPIATRRGNLAQVLFAIGAHAKTDQNGVLRIESLWDGVSSSIPPDRIFWGDKVTYESKVTEVSVLEHKYIKGTEEVTLFEGTAVAGDVIQFSEPAYDLAASGFSVQSSGANYAVLSAGTGTLTGKKYVHMTRDVRAPVLADDVDNVIEVKEATLVSLTNSAAVAQRLAGYYQYIEVLDHEVVYGGERPGDVVAFEHPYGGKSKGCIKDTAITIGGSLVASEQITVGYKPPQYEESVLFDQVEILTGDGQWTVPDGVTNVRAVLIGGGRGGKPGKAGENGDAGKKSPGSPLWYDSGNISPGPGGEGGEGGEGGLGGDIYEVNLDVTTGQVFPFYSGSGGSSDAEGTATTFGEHTSTSGAPIEHGFTEQISGVVYAKKGIPGQAGGRGSGGTGEESWEIIEGNHIGDFGPGAKGADRSASKRGYFDNSSVYAVSVNGNSNGGLGGGAAVGASGSPGGSGSVYVDVDTGLNFEEEKTFSGSLSLTPGPGGNGATPPPPAAKASIGDGGDGGHGGGGGGGPGGGSYTVNLNSNSWPSARCNISVSLSNGVPGTGGSGGAGGTGGPGGIILYYGVPKEVQSGQMKDKNGKVMLDRLGRRLIV